MDDEHPRPARDRVDRSQGFDRAARQVVPHDLDLAQAQRQIQEATAEVVKTRKQLEAWQSDVTALTQRLRSVERDNRDTLETITRTLEKMLERDREPARGAEAPGPELLPLPRQP